MWESGEKISTQIVAGEEPQAQFSSSNPALFPLLYVTGQEWQGGVFSSQLAVQRHLSDISVIHNADIGVKLYNYT